MKALAESLHARGIDVTVLRLPGPGTLPTNGPLFSALLVGVVVIVGALTFFPALGLSPVVEHFLMQSGKVF